VHQLVNKDFGTLRMFGKRQLRIIYIIIICIIIIGRRKNKSGWRTLHDVGIRNLFSSHSICLNMKD